MKHLASAWERADTSFFAGTRPRLRRWTCSNMVLGKEMQLDRDLLIFQRALNNKVPDWPEGEDWKLPLIIDQFQNSQLKAMMPKFLRFVLTRSLPRNNTLYVVLQQKCWFWHFCFHKNIIRLTLRVKITRPWKSTLSLQQAHVLLCCLVISSLNIRKLEALQNFACS